MIHKRSTALERSVKIFTGGLKPVSQRANLTLSSDVDHEILMLVCMNTPRLSMHHLQKHVNQDIKRR